MKNFEAKIGGQSYTFDFTEDKTGRPLLRILSGKKLILKITSDEISDVLGDFKGILISFSNYEIKKAKEERKASKKESTLYFENETKAWSKEDDEFILKSFGILTKKEIAAKLSKSLPSISSRLEKLLLKKK